MYNEQIEALISAALADGMLTEKEKQILFKKAQAQGIDLDEFEMVLDARVFKMNTEREENIKETEEKKRTSSIINFDRINEIKQSIQQDYDRCTKGRNLVLNTGRTKIAAQNNADIIEEEKERVQHAEDKFILSLSCKEGDIEYNFAILDFIRTFIIISYEEEKYIIKDIQDGDYKDKSLNSFLQDASDRLNQDSEITTHFFNICANIEEMYSSEPMILNELPIVYKERKKILKNLSELFIEAKSLHEKRDEVVKKYKISYRSAIIIFWIIVIWGTYDENLWDWWKIFFIVPIGLLVFFIIKRILKSIIRKQSPFPWKENEYSDSFNFALGFIDSIFI